MFSDRKLDLPTHGIAAIVYIHWPLSEHFPPFN